MSTKNSINLVSPVERSKAINGDFGNRYLKQGQIAKIRSDFAAHFADHPDYQPFGSATVNGEPRRLIVSKHKSELTQKDVIAYPGEDIGIGDIIECYGSHWMVTQKDPNTDMYSKGLMELCSTKLRWQNPKTFEIIERWVMIINPYSVNLSESNVITTLQGKYQIFVTKDAESLAVEPDKRFILGEAGGIPLVYKLSFPDHYAETYDGLGQGIIVWNVVSDEDIHGEDNLDLMIADYIEPPESEVPPDEEIFLTGSITGNDYVIVGYSTLFRCVFKDGNGTVKTPDLETIEWAVECSEDLRPLITLEPDGDSCKVYVADDDEAINKKFVLCCKAAKSDTSKFEVECVVM